MRSYIIIGIIVFYANIVSSDSTSTPAPTLTFECNPEGQVTNITGVSLDKLVWDNNGTYCHIFDINCKWQSQKSLRIFYDDDEVNSKIVAARHPHFYELDCKNEFDLSPTAQHIAIGSVSTKTPITRYTPTPPTITLSILKGSSILQGSVFIGELLSLQITVGGNYKIDPKICSASDGTPTQTNYTLWDSSNCASKDIAIMDNIWSLTMNSSNASIPFYAFKFVDSNTVTIKCTAHVYPTSTDYTTLCPKTGTGRRRRSADIETRFMSNMRDESATASFTIRHVTNDSSNSEGLSISLMLYLLAVGASIAIMRCV